jgi:hypothetical protein
MLGKLVGAVLAVIGVAGLVLIWTGKSGPLLSSLVPYLFSVLLGFFLFFFCDRLLARGEKGRSLQNIPARNQVWANVVVWSLLLFLAAVFLLGTYFFTR